MKELKQMIEINVKVIDTESSELGIKQEPEVNRMAIDPLEIRAYFENEEGTSITLNGMEWLLTSIPYEQFKLIMTQNGIPVYNSYYYKA